jgi:Tol biopolymer transport system component
LIYQAGGVKHGEIQLEWFDRMGKSIGRIATPVDYGGVDLSPDDKKIAFDFYDSQSRNRDIWIYDIARELKTRFTFDPAVDQYAVWSPDGSCVVFSSNRQGASDLYQKTTSGAGVEELLVESADEKFPFDWSSDGRFIAYINFRTREDLWILPIDSNEEGADRKPFAFLQTEFDEDVSQFSPDMRWIAYASNESGNWELYVRPFLGADGQPGVNQTRKWQVSTGGISPSNNSVKWNRNGRELFYLSNDNRVMVAQVETSGSTFDVGAVRPLFEVKTQGVINNLNVTADGQRFLIGIPIGGQSVPPPTLVTNWDAGLRKK